MTSDSNERVIRGLLGVVRALKDLHRAIGADRRDADPLDGPAFALLSRLAECGPTRVTALAEALLVDTSTVSRQLTALEETGWVARDRDPADARAHLLHITTEGREVLDRSWQRRRDALQAVLRGWSEGDLQGLADHLERFNDDMATFRAAGYRGAGQETT